MKKLIALFAVLSLMTACSLVDKAPEKKVAPAPAKVAVPAKKSASAKVRPALTHPQSWNMVIVPDIQTYIKQIENQGILDMMLAWIVRRREEMNIQQVLFTGDLVYYNATGRVVKQDGRIYGGRMTDLVCDEQWKATSRILKRLDGEVPYILCTGNHDYGARSAENRLTGFNTHFPRKTHQDSIVLIKR